MATNEDSIKFCFSEAEKSFFKRFSDVLKNTQFYHNSTIEEKDFNLLTAKLTTWPNEYVMPFLDYFRMFLLHPRSHDFFKKTGSGLAELGSLLERYKNGSDNIKIITLRILLNYFYYEYPRVFIAGRRQSVLELVSIVLDSENKNIRSGIASLLYK